MVRGKGKPPRVLAIESSFDDVSVCLLSGKDSRQWHRELREYFKPFGGLVPSMARGLHEQRLAEIFAKAKLSGDDFDYVAYTKGPGQEGCLTAGFNAARMIASLYAKPLVPVNHLVHRTLAFRSHTL